MLLIVCPVRRIQKYMTINAGIKGTSPAHNRQKLTILIAAT